MASTEAKNKQAGQSVSAVRRAARLRRHARLRKKGHGTPERPRLVVNRSSRHIHVQLVNDVTGTTLAAASSIEPDVRTVEGDKKAHSVRVGQLIAERAKARRCRHRGLRPWRIHLRRTDRSARRRGARKRAEVLAGGLERSDQGLMMIYNGRFA